MTTTPGPWKIAPDPKHLTASPLIISETRNIAKVLYDGGSEDREVDANARLIASAPKMAELLRRAEELLERSKRIIQSSSSGIPHLIEGSLESLAWEIDDLLIENGASDYKFIAAEGPKQESAK